MSKALEKKISQVTLENILNSKVKDNRKIIEVVERIKNLKRKCPAFNSVEAEFFSEIDLELRC